MTKIYNANRLYKTNITSVSSTGEGLGDRNVFLKNLVSSNKKKGGRTQLEKYFIFEKTRVQGQEKCTS